MISPRKSCILQESYTVVVDLGKDVDAQFVVDHQSKHTHLGSTSLVKFLGAEVELLFLGIVLDPADREGLGSREITRVRAGGLLPEDLQKTAENKDLDGTLPRDRETAIPPGGEVGEFGSVRDLTGQAGAVVGGKVSDHTKLADTPVLDLDGAKAFELRLVAISNKSKGIPVPERLLDTCNNQDITKRKRIG